MVDDDPRARLAALDAEIEDARRRLATLRHEGERHFVDDVPVDPEVSALLKKVVATAEGLQLLRLNRATGPKVRLTDEEHTRLLELEQQIDRLRKLSGPKDERHFIDG